MPDWSRARTYRGDPADVVAELSQFLEPPAWHRDAACRETSGVNFFPRFGEDAEPAKAVCAGCPVRGECLAFAAGYSERDLVGIWGGTSGRDRHAMRRRSAA